MKKTKLPICKIIIILLVIIIVYIGMGAFAFYKFGKVENAGIFGDMFGAVNALFSGFAMFGVILTIFMHTKWREISKV